MNFLNSKAKEMESVDILLEGIGEMYAEFRIPDPCAEALMLKSLERYGQVSPVVVSREDKNRYELLDGFKRLHACRRLSSFISLNAKVLELTVHARKAAVVLLNRAGKISDTEEALVVHSLYHDDCLTQVEIAKLLNRHKSWVCRRVSLIQDLCDEARESIKLGLISVSIGRGLSRLPRGNQDRALSAIQRHGLSCRETEKLVSALLTRPKSEHDSILTDPQKIVMDRANPILELKDNRLSQWGLAFKKKLVSMEQRCFTVAQGVNAEALSCLNEGDMVCLSPQIGRVIRSAQLTVEKLQEVLSCQ